MAARVSPLRLLSAAMHLLVWPGLMLAVGGWRWPEGWVFAGWFVAMCTHTLVWLYRHDPALLEERYRKPGSGGQSRADLSAASCCCRDGSSSSARSPTTRFSHRWCASRPSVGTA